MCYTSRMSGSKRTLALSRHRLLAITETGGSCACGRTFSPSMNADEARRRDQVLDAYNSHLPAALDRFIKSDADPARLPPESNQP